MGSPTEGDVDYSVFGDGYSDQRRPDARIEAIIHGVLRETRSVVNVGAGAGSYEPRDRWVVPIEPSLDMRSQRPPYLAPAIRGIAENLPLDDQSIDAGMATVTIHQWRDTERGIAELRRVVRGPIVILTFDGDALDRFWLAEYAPELIEVERRRYPKIDWICERLGGDCEVTEIPIPIDCTDGFSEAFYARPEKFLEPQIRKAQSAWSFLKTGADLAIVDRLLVELDDGRWEAKHGHLRSAPSFVGSLRLIVSRNR